MAHKVRAFSVAKGNGGLAGASRSLMRASSGADNAARHAWIGDHGAQGGSNIISGDVDPFFDNVVLLASMDGLDDTTEFADYKGHPLSLVGSAIRATEQAKFGTGSLDLNGTGAALSTPDSEDWFFPGDFTVEGWFYLPSSIAGTIRVLVAQWGTALPGTGTSWQILVNGIANRLQFNVSTDGSTTDTFVQTTNAPPLTTWNYFAASRNGNQLEVSLNGAGFNTAAFSGALHNSTEALHIGRAAGGNGFLGFIDEVRITKGVARYAGAAAPVPERAFPRR